MLCASVQGNQHLIGYRVDAFLSETIAQNNPVMTTIELNNNLIMPGYIIVSVCSRRARVVSCFLIVCCVRAAA